MWPFHNFSTPELTQQDYAATYTEIAEDESDLRHPFDAWWFENVYKTCAKEGNCFGMVVLALYALKGESVFPEPIYSNPFLHYGKGLVDHHSPDASAEPDDERFITPINIMQGYSLDQAVEDWLGDLEDQGVTRDPARIFALSKAVDESGEPQVLCLSIVDESGAKHGHAVLPYAWEQDGHGMRILMANPNSPWTPGSDLRATDSCITITTGKSVSTWIFNLGGQEWIGGAEVPGSVIAHVPFSVVGTRSERGGGSDLIGAVGNCGTIVLAPGTDGEAVEVGGVAGVAVEHNGAFGIRGLAELPPAGSSPLRSKLYQGSTQDKRPIGRVKSWRPARLFRLKRALDLPRVASPMPTGPASLLPRNVDNPTLRWTLRPILGTATSMALRSGAGSAVVVLDGEPSEDTVEVSSILAGRLSIAVSTAKVGARQASVSLSGRLASSGVLVVAKVEKLGLPDAVSVRLLDDGVGVAIGHTGDSLLTCTVTIASSTGGSVSRAGVPIAAGSATTLEVVNPGQPFAGQQLSLTRLGSDGSVIAQTRI
jgi:hypothetical protein